MDRPLLLEWDDVLADPRRTRTSRLSRQSLTDAGCRSIHTRRSIVHFVRWRSRGGMRSDVRVSLVNLLVILSVNEVILVVEL